MIKILSLIIFIVISACVFDKNITEVSTNGSGYFMYPAVGNSERQPELIDPAMISYCRNYNGGSVRILNKLEYYLNNPNTEAVATNNQSNLSISTVVKAFQKQQ